MPANLTANLQTLRETCQPHVLVIVTSVRGSTPQDAGAKMIVTADGRADGTVGGGKIEAAAIRHAQALLDAPGTAPPTENLEWNLQRDIGMTCGGTMTLYFEAWRGAAWTLAIFGAGHVAAALIPVIAPLDCRIHCQDPRAEWIERLPTAPNVTATITPDLAASVDDLPDATYALLMTQGHATDFPILKRILTTRKFPFVGVIGSRSKRATLERELREAGVPPARSTDFQCPLGLAVGTNHPHEIAISIAAGLLAARDEIQRAEAT